MSNANSSGGAGFFSLLAIAFIVLKLIGLIHWSWWWLLSPIWIPVVLLALIFIVWLTYRARKGKHGRDLS